MNAIKLETRKHKRSYKKASAKVYQDRWREKLQKLSKRIIRRIRYSHDGVCQCITLRGILNPSGFMFPGTDVFSMELTSGPGVRRKVKARYTNRIDVCMTPLYTPRVWNLFAYTGLDIRSTLLRGDDRVMRILSILFGNCIPRSGMRFEQEKNLAHFSNCKSIVVNKVWVRIEAMMKHLNPDYICLDQAKSSMPDLGDTSRMDMEQSKNIIKQTYPHVCASTLLAFPVVFYPPIPMQALGRQAFQTASTYVVDNRDLHPLHRGDEDALHNGCWLDAGCIREDIHFVVHKGMRYVPLRFMDPDHTLVYAFQIISFEYAREIHALHDSGTPRIIAIGLDPRNTTWVMAGNGVVFLDQERCCLNIT